MEKNNIVALIERGLLDHYLQIDYSKSKEKSSDVEESNDLLFERKNEYKKRANKILFKFKLASKKDGLERILSIAKNRLEDLPKINNDNIFQQFKLKLEESSLKLSYRNFESMSEDEMRSVLNQLDLTSILDQIESELEDE